MRAWREAKAWALAAAAVWAIGARGDCEFSEKELDKGMWVAKGVEDGEYYLHLRVQEGTPWHGFPELRHCGRVVDFDCAGPYEPDDKGRKWRTMQAGPVKVKDGDGFQPKLPHRKGTLKITKEPLKFAPQKIYTIASVPEAAYKLNGEFRDGGKVRVRVDNFTGGAKKADVTLTVSDFYQRELSRKEFKGVEVGRTKEFEIEYKDNYNGQFRAKAELKDEEGRTASRIFPHLATMRTEHRETVRFNKGWERTTAKAKSDEEKRRLPTGTPPADAKWTAVEMPSANLEDFAWFRTEKEIPATFAGKEVWFKVHRMLGDGELYIDGEKAGDFGKDLIFYSEQEINITKFVKPGAKQKFLLTNRARNLAVTSNVKLEKQIIDATHNFALVRNGAVAEITLEARPKTAIGNIRVYTSYRDKEIRVEAARPAGYGIRNTVWLKDEKQIEFGEKAKWENPPLWGPYEFPLLRLVTEMTDGEGRVVDEKVTRFGFREFWADGMKMMWNGQRVRGEGRAFGSTWGGGMRNIDVKCKPQNNCDTVYDFRNAGVRFMRHIHNGSEYIDFCDEAGMAISKSGWVAWGPSAELSANAEIWKVKEANDRKMIDAYFNHPSIMTWYISNEYYAESDDRHYKPVASAVRNARAADGTRFVEAGCDIDLRGNSNLISTHYPVEAHALRDPKCYMPYCFYWRHENEKFNAGDKVPKGQVLKVENCPPPSPITWGTKPIVINETCWDQLFSPPFGYTRLCGDEVFNEPRFNEKWHLETSIEAMRGHRDAEVTLWTPWRWAVTDPKERTFPLVDAAPVQRYSHFYEGTRAGWDMSLYCDSWKRGDRLEWFWRLESAKGETVIEGEREEMACECSEMWRRRVEATMPRAGEYVLRYGFKGRCEKAMEIRTYPRAKVVLPGNVIKAEDKLEKSLLERARAGETIVVLARDDYPEWLPEAPEPTGHSAAILHTFRGRHPLLAGITPDEMRYFHPDSVAVKDSFFKPLAGNARTVIEAGGPSGLTYSALIEVPYGKGCFVYSRLELDAEKNPVAAKLLANMAKHKCTKTPGRALYVAGKDEVLETALRVRHGAEIERGEIRDAGKYAAVLVDGSRGLSGEEIGLLQKSGKAVLVFNPGKEFGVGTRAVTTRDWKGRAVRTGADELTDGLTNQDMMWRTNYGNPDTAAANLGKEELATEEGALLYPVYAARRGNIVLVTADCTIRNFAVEQGFRRFWSTLLGNAGVAIKEFKKPELPKNLFFEPVDLTEHFDRTLEDEVENDGKGSWNDQGKHHVLAMKFRHPTAWVGMTPFQVKTEGACAFALATEHRNGGVSNVTVKIGRKADTFSWLHAPAFAGKGKRHFTVRLKYEDGTEAKVNGMGGMNVHDWCKPDPSFAGDMETHCGYVTFRNPNPRSFPKNNVYSMTWVNPQPGKVVKELTFERGEKYCARTGVFALTIGSRTNEYTGWDAKRRAELRDRLVEEAEAALKAKKREEAIAKYEQALRACPESVWLYRSIGLIYEQMHDWEYALITYRRSLAANVNQPDILELEKSMKKKLNIK